MQEVQTGTTKVKVFYHIGKSRKNPNPKKHEIVLTMVNNWTYKKLKEVIKTEIKARKSISIVKAIAA